MMNTAEITAKSEAETRDYLVIDAESDFRSLATWHSHCKRSRIPFIDIHCRKKYATVTWDSRVLPFDLDNLADEKEAELFSGFQKLLDKYGNKKSWLMGRRLPQFQNISIDLAEDLAEELYDLVATTLGMGAKV